MWMGIRGFMPFLTFYFHPTVIMIMAGYLGAVSVVTTVKWFWFVIAMGLFVPVSVKCDVSR